MRIPFVVAISMTLLVIPMHRASGADTGAQTLPAPASVFTTNDLPSAEGGKPTWNGTHGCGITYYGKWVYAVSAAESILQFECDPVTAKLTYKGATPLGYPNKDSTKGIVIRTWIRPVDDNHAKLIVFYGDHNKGLSWYGIDKSTGKLTFESVQCPAKSDHHNATHLVTPDQQHFCYGGRVLDKVDWYRFGEDGLPVPDGSFALTNSSTGNVGMSSGCVMASPDWKHLYCMVFQCDDKDPKNDKTPQIDTYNIDLKTHAGTYVSSVKLPAPDTMKGRVSGTLEPFSPDGKFTYAILRMGNISCYYTLARDPQSGTLTVVGQTPATNASSLGGLTGAPWSRQDRFAYAADGQSGYFVNNGPLERFNRDPATGALTLLSPVPGMGASKLALDPVNGVLFTAGEKIASLKITLPKSESIAGTK